MCVIDEKIICKKCVLHSNVPNIKINQNGLCNMCQIIESNDNKVSDFFTKKAEKLFEKVKKENRTYDIIVMFSGGKDSTALLNVIKNKYGLKPLALAIMHPLVGELASRNMDEVAKKLQVDLYKYYPDQNIYKDYMKYGLMNADKYGLGESAGCRLCGFLYHWAGTRIAMEMNIPILVDGADKSQILNNYWSGEIVRRRIEEGILPYGVLHEIFHDSITSKYGRTIYDFDKKKFATYKFPTQMSPFSFMEYDFREYEKEFVKIKLSNDNYKKMLTTCKAIHFFDYITFKRYDCPSYIQHWANGLRQGYPALMQLDSRDYDEVGELKRDEILKLMEEYKEAVFYVGSRKLDEHGKQQAKEYIMVKSKCSRKYYGKEAFENLVDNILSIHDFAEYFQIDLSSI